MRRYAAADELARAAECHPVLAHENKWRAARYGLDGTVVDTGDGGGQVPLRGLIERTLAEIGPHARELGCERELAGVVEILRDGNGAERQLRAYAADGDPVAVARAIADVTET